MTIRYKCEECGVSMKIKDDLAGRTGKCPKCKHSFIIPPPEDEVPVDDVPVPEDEPEEDEGEFDDDDDDFPDMPMELTAAPTVAPAEPPPPAAPRPTTRDRKEASETKKATRMSSRPKAGKKKSKSGEFDAADFLMGDDDGPATGGGSSRPAPMEPSRPAPPRGRVGGLDDDDDEPGQGPKNSSMSEMFRDFVPAGGVKREASGVASTSAAAEALARRAEEKRSQSNMSVGFDIPDKKPEEEGTDYVQAAKDVWNQFGLYIGGFIVVLIGVYLMTSSMFSSGSDIPDLYTVRGYVSKDGVPVEGAELFFNPADTSREAMAGNNNGGHAATNAEGYYEFQYLPGEWGLPAGRYTVQVLKGGIPFAKATTKVVEEQTNDMNFQY